MYIYYFFLLIISLILSILILIKHPTEKINNITQYCSSLNEEDFNLLSGINNKQHPEFNLQYIPENVWDNNKKWTYSYYSFDKSFQKWTNDTKQMVYKDGPIKDNNIQCSDNKITFKNNTSYCIGVSSTGSCRARTEMENNHQKILANDLLKYKYNF